MKILETNVYRGNTKIPGHIAQNAIRLECGNYREMEIPANDMMHIYTSLDYERRRPVREQQLSEKRLRLIRCKGL